MATLGIEAVQNLIYREASDVLGDSGEYVSARHLMLLAAKMCHYGQPVPVTRHGMKRSKAGVLVSASFERTVETFVQAAIHEQADSCGGVTESIVMNRLARIGSGFVTLLQAPEPKKAEMPQFVGRRRKQAKIDDDKPSTFRATWRFKVDPEHLFNISTVQKSSKQPFTPPPLATAAWGDAPPSPPMPNAAVWGDVDEEPPPSPEFPPSPKEDDLLSEDEGVKHTSFSNDTNARTVGTWSVRIQSPRLSTAESVHTLVPWVVRPTSPEYK